MTLENSHSNNFFFPNKDDSMFKTQSAWPFIKLSSHFSKHPRIIKSNKINWALTQKEIICFLLDLFKLPLSHSIKFKEKHDEDFNYNSLSQSFSVMPKFKHFAIVALLWFSKSSLPLKNLKTSMAMSRSQVKRQS